jgi:hypothetical protein
LVQACRYLSERLLEAWEECERQAQATQQGHLFEKKDREPVAVRITPFGLPSQGGLYEQVIPLELAERQTYARRIIAQRCLYGVDKNPLAVEMAKLSLWLLTLAKDKPFEFLDHAIRCGDSLVGIHDLRQLEKFNLNPKAPQTVWYSGPITKMVGEAVDLRQTIETMPSNSVEDVEAQEKLLTEADKKTARLRCAADLLLSVEFQGANAADKLSLHDSMVIQAGHYVENGTIEEFREVVRMALKGQQTFHWPLEFPEVFQKRGGFDAFLGNPPFMGGARLEPQFGASYRAYLVAYLAKGIRGVRGTADLCSYFFARIGGLLQERGVLTLLATNTIGQGDSRLVGLDNLVAAGCQIIRALTQKWPGDAALEVSVVNVARGRWLGKHYIDNKPVTRIDSYLSEANDAGLTPQVLSANSDRAFKGATVAGMGFILEASEAMELLKRDPRNAQVVFPYLNGEDVTTNPDHKPSRYVINFFDYPLDRASVPPGYSGPTAEDFPECLRIVVERVMPERLSYAPRNSWNRAIRNHWWQFGLWRPALNEATKALHDVLVTPEVSKYIVFCRMPNTMVFSHMVYVLAYDSWKHFGLYQSTFHVNWAAMAGSTLETRHRYTVRSCFETFPQPSSLKGLEWVSRQCHGCRSEAMLTRNEGLTKTYNRLHDSDETSADIQKLRQLHVEMDQAVAAAYGWTDLDLGHGFHQTKQGVRYTISEAARREVLGRLLKLNHERYAEEVAKGLHEKKKPKAMKGKKKTEPADSGRSLFGEDGS